MPTIDSPVVLLTLQVTLVSFVVRARLKLLALLPDTRYTSVMLFA